MSTPEFIAKLGTCNEQGTWKPRLFDLGQPSDAEALSVLVARGALVDHADTVRDQLHELVEVRNPLLKLSDSDVGELAGQHIGQQRLSEYGHWVYYPWQRRVVHVLPRAEYREVRTARNRYKITPDEQARLAEATIGIVGLSVGQSIATTMALEGVGGTFRLADFDRISLSNTNRLLAGAETLGLNKAVLAARRLYEIDPYLDVEVFAAGVSEENLAAFLGEQRKLDLLVEECDDLFTKVHIRERARSLGIPVIMETNDRGMLDVERYDLEPSRPLFHGRLGKVRSENLKNLTTKEKVPFVMSIVDAQRVSHRLLASLVEIDETVGSWPQLASGTALGAALVTDTARRILLGEFADSGRYYVDLEQIIRSPSSASPEQGTTIGAPSVSPPKPSASGDTRAPHATLGDGVLSVSVLEQIVAMGVRAPSGGNNQPWVFRWEADGRLRCELDMERAASFLDYGFRAAVWSLGAAVENMVVTAAGLGLNTDVQLRRDVAKLPICWLSFRREPVDDPSRALAESVEARETNRKIGKRIGLSANEQDELYAAAALHHGRLELLTEVDALDEAASIIGAVDRFRVLCQPLHREVMSEVRWTEEEAESTRDGIDIATLELSAADSVGLRALNGWAAVEFLRRIGGGKALERPARKSIGGADAVGLVTVAGVEPADYFDGGRAMQRVWLVATRLGLAVQPMSVAPYLFVRLEQGNGEGFSHSECEQLRRLRRRHLQLFSHAPERGEVLLFRITHADPPSKRSLRRPVGEFLEIAAEEAILSR